MSAEECVLTIIVPVYNRATVVERTLDSIAAQSHRPLSLIIVDNNSADDSAAVVERWARAQRSDTFQITTAVETLPGATAARNRGLQLATTPWVMFFDSDDTMVPSLVSEIVAATATDSRVDIIGWDRHVEVPGRSHLHLSRFDPVSHPIYRNLVHGMMCTTQYAARRELFERAGRWNNDVKVWNDMELGLRLLLLDPVMKKLAGGVKVYVYNTPDSITNTHSSDSVSPAKEKALECCEAAARAAGRDDIVKWVDYRRILLAARYAKAGMHADSRRLMATLTTRPRFVNSLIGYIHRLYPRGTHLFYPHRHP